MSDPVRPHRWQPTRLPHPWDSPGKNTGVSCHFLLQCMKVKSQSEVAQSYPTPRDPMNYSPPGSSIHGIVQARVLEWGAIAFSAHLPKMPSNTALISGPAVGAAQILIWSYSCVFLSPMSTAIRASAFSFVGALSGLLYIPDTESA